MEATQSVPQVNRCCQSYSENGDWLWWGCPLNQPVLQILVVLSKFLKKKRRKSQLVFQQNGVTERLMLISCHKGWYDGKQCGFTNWWCDRQHIFLFSVEQLQNCKTKYKWLEPWKAELLLKMYVANSFSTWCSQLDKGTECHLVISAVLSLVFFLLVTFFNLETRQGGSMGASVTEGCHDAELVL